MHNTWQISNLVFENYSVYVNMFQVHFYCPACKFYLGKNQERQDCGRCKKAFISEQCMKNGSFFLYIPLQGQLMEMLKDPKMFAYLTNREVKATRRNANISDVTSSELYQQLIRNNNLSKNDMTITWNTDGMSVFKSSKYSIWPIQCTVNELPPRIYFNNILLTGLLFGREKPNMNTFLTPFVQECTDLEEN